MVSFIFIYEENMGRKKKYFTIEEKREAKNKARKKYYEKNRERINKTRMEKYYEDKRNKSLRDL